MAIDKTGLDSRVFTAFAETSDRRYFYLCNMQTDVSRWSRRAVEYFGLPDEYMEGADKIWETFIHPDDREVYKEDIREVFSGEKKYHNMEYRARNKEGNYVICTCRGIILHGENGEPDLFAGTILNHGIVDRVDATTNLYNIYEFLHTVRQLSQMKEAALVMMVGLNQFRTVNDTYGYAFGNQVLKTFATMLMELVRGRGMVYRMDGAKFALCVRQMDMDEAKELYARIQDLARNAVIVDNTHILLGVSGGAVLVDNSNAGEYSIRASVAYAQDKSKRECHSSLVFFDSEQESRNLRSLELLETIRQCVLRGCKGFFMCYQPLVGAQDGRIVGMEALLRWEQEPYGELLPGAFIQWLEKDDCIFELGNWILRQSMLDGLRIIKEQPDFMVNVNVSYTQLDRSEFRDALMEILRETGFPPQNLYIELTERCQTMDLEQLRENLNFFCSCGIRIALDDFGTGTASMNLLRELPISCVKIDRAFISDIQTNRTDEILVEMVIDSAHKLGMSVCMEGVETRELRDYLQKYNATTHQGYYYSRPVRIEKFMELLDAEKKNADRNDT